MKTKNCTIVFLFIFGLVALIWMVIPFEDLTYEEMPKFIGGLIGGARDQAIEDYLDQSSLINDYQHRVIIDKSLQSSVTYHQILVSTDECRGEILFKNPEVVIQAYCDVVFVVTLDLRIHHITARDVFIRHRQELVPAPAKTPSGGSGSAEGTENDE